MTRELVSFFAPPKQLARSGLIAAGISCVLLPLHWDWLSLPALSLWFAWWLSGSFVHIAIQPISSWDRAWPVPHRLLRGTRILAAWLASWVPALAPAIAASALYGLGMVTRAAWARAVFHSLCVIGLVPLACASSHRLSDRPRGSPVHVAALILLPALALEAFVSLSRLDEQSSAGALLGLGVIVGVFTGALGLLLTRAWLESPELHSSLARQRGARSARPGAGARGKSSLLAGLRATPAWFFFLESRWQAVGAWIYLVIIMGFARLQFSAVMWYLATTFWFSGYSGSSQPGPLPAYLPIARRRVLAYMLAPLAVLLASGLSLEHLLPQRRGGVEAGFYTGDLSVLSRGDSHTYSNLYRLVVPSFSWRASWGEPPLVTTPEGVSRRLTTFRVVPGLPLNVYHPYEARFDDDPAFVNYQVSRVISDEWHMDVSPADVEKSCHALERGKMTPACLEGQLITKYQPPRAWPVIECWLLCLLTLLTLQMRIGGQSSRYSPRRWLGLLWLLPTLALAMVLDEVGGRDPTGPMSWAFRGAVLLGELTRLVERAPLAWGLSGLLLLLGVYGYVERTFTRMEGFVGRRSW